MFKIRRHCIFQDHPIACQVAVSWWGQWHQPEIGTSRSRDSNLGFPVLLVGKSASWNSHVAESKEVLWEKSYESHSVIFRVLLFLGAVLQCHRSSPWTRFSLDRQPFCISHFASWKLPTSTKAHDVCELELPRCQSWNFLLINQINPTCRNALVLAGPRVMLWKSLLCVQKKEDSGDSLEIQLKTDLWTISDNFLERSHCTWLLKRLTPRHSP